MTLSTLFVLYRLALLEYRVLKHGLIALEWAAAR